MKLLLLQRNEHWEGLASNYSIALVCVAAAAFVEMDADNTVECRLAQRKKGRSATHTTLRSSGSMGRWMRAHDTYNKKNVALLI